MYVHGIYTYSISFLIEYSGSKKLAELPQLRLKNTQNYEV